MKVGLTLPQLGEHVTLDALREFSVRAEALGYHSLWAQEHLFYPHESASGYAGQPGMKTPDFYRSVLAPTEMLAAVAAWTDRVMIGTSVLIAGYHWPVETAQRLATLDVLSGGRLVAGFAVGWSDEEHEVVGVNPRTRGRRMDEFIEALIACWSDDPVSFEGEFFHIPKSDVRPKPVQKPYPALLSGMWSPAGMDRTVAHFDIWNPALGTPASVREQFDQLNAKRAPGRAPLRLFYETFVQYPFEMPGLPEPGVDTLVAVVGEAVEAGVEELIIESNFWREINSPEIWAKVPDLLSPVLAVAGVDADIAPVQLG